MKSSPVSGVLRSICIATAATALVLGFSAPAQEAVPVFVTLTSATPIGTPPTTVTIDAPGGGWDYSAAAPVAGTTWNSVYRPTSTPASAGTFTDAAPFIIDSLNNAQLYSASGSLSPVRLSAVLIGSNSRAEPGYVNASSAQNVKPLLNACWRVYGGDTVIHMRFRFSGLVPNTHYYLYCYSNTNGTNATSGQGGRYILHPSNFPTGKTSTFIYPGLSAEENLPTTYVDLAGFASTLSLFRDAGGGNRTIIAPAPTNTPEVAGDNTIWGAMHAVSSAAGEITFRTASNAQGARFYTGFQLIPYPNPTVVEQPDAETVGVLDQVTEIFAVARDMPGLSDADQNPLAYLWQVSKDNGATWTDLPNVEPTGEGVHIGSSVIRDPALPTNPETPPVPAHKLTYVLTINHTQNADAGRYRLKVTNVAGGTTYSSASTVTVINQPAPFVITQQPTGGNVVVGDSVGLTTAVSGTAPFAFVWQKSDTADFSSFTEVKRGARGPATSDTLSFPLVRRSDLGYYRAAITDVTRRNPIYTSIVYLYVEYARPIITSPGPQSVVPGNSISIFGNVYSEIEVTRYQWQVSRDNGATWSDVTEGGAYSGTNSGTLRIASAAADNAGLYRVAATNAIGTTTGTPVQLSVAAAIAAHPVAVAADQDGHVYVTDDTSNAVYQYDFDTRTAVLFAGKSGEAGHADGSYSQATFNGPAGAVAGPANTIFVADTLNATIRYVQANGVVQTLAGSALVRDNVDGTGASAAFSAPAGVAVDAAGNLYVADRVSHTIRRITPLSFDVTTLAGTPGSTGFANATVSDSSSNRGSLFNAPGAVAVSPVNLTTTPTGVTATLESPTTTTTTLYVADTGNNTIRKITLTWYLDRDPLTNVQTRTRISKSEVTTLAGLAGVSGSADGAALNARFNAPGGIAVDQAGAIYVADTANHTVRKIVVVNSTTVTVTTLGGLPGVSGYQDGPDANSSLFNQPRAVSVDSGGNVYVADTGNSAVRKISPDGRVSTLVFNRGTDPVPSTNTGGTENPAPIIPPAGSGNRGGDLGVGGGGAPSHWFFGALAVLALLRSRKQIMKLRGLHYVGVAAVIGATLACVPAARAQNPAVFVNLSTTQATTAGETLVTAPTFTIAAPGNGWAYGAAAPYAGETWNNILSPNASDQIKPASKGYVRYDVVPLITANNIALTQPDGTASGVTLTASAVLNDAGTATNTREVPRLVNVSSSTPGGLLGMAWRIYEGGNLLRFAFAGLPADAHYLVYCYGTTNGANQGARFTLADANSPVTPAVWFETNPAANTAPSLFVDTAGALAPSAAAPLQVASNAAGGANAGTTWGVMHAKVDSAGKLVLDVGRNANNNGFPNGFQVVPYPKATLTSDLPSSTVATLNNPVTLTVAASGFDPSDTVSYQWRKAGAPISGATSAAYTIASASSGDEGSYDVVVTNFGGNVVSSATALTVTSSTVAPSVTQQPTAQTAATGGSVTFTVSANGTSPLTYTWQKSITGKAESDFSDIINSSGNSAALGLSSITTADAGYYRVKVSNGTLPDAFSDPVTLTVAPVITTPPVGSVVAPGAATSLSAVASTGPANADFASTYAWKRNGVAISDGSGIVGATTATLSFASFAPANSGTYTVTVTNAAGSVSSPAVYLGTPTAMTATQWPATGATGVNPDTPLKLTFSGGIPVLGNIGVVTIRDAADGTIVKSIDLSTLETLDGGNRPGYITTAVQGSTISYRPVAVYGNEVWITGPGGLGLLYGKTYYVTIQPGVLFDELGATYPGISDSTTWRFSTRTAAPDVSSRTIAVAADGSADFTTVQAALNQVPQNNTEATPYVITLAPGVYHESLVLGQNRKFLTLKGTGATRTDAVISHGWCNATNGAVSAAFIIYVDDVRVENLTIDNTAGETAGQQRAVTMNNKRIVFDRVLLKGWQDTLAVWNNAAAYFRDCEIWGSVDFIYGGGTALFDHCDIVTIRDGSQIAAPSTNIANPYGLVFRDCRLIKGRLATGQPKDVTAASCGLMRPWYPDGHAAFIHCQIDDHISAKGWAEWDGRENTSRAREAGSTLLSGGAAPTIADRQAAGAYWLNTMDPDYTGAQSATDPLLALPAGPVNRTPVTVNPDEHTVDTIFGSAYLALGSWRPTVVPRISTQPVSQTVAPGQPVTLTVGAFGLPAASYQWYKGTTVLEGATSSQYAVAAANQADAGEYHVVVTNSLGSATSATAVLTVSEGGLPTPPAITSQPVSQVGSVGGPITLSVVATGGGSVQWFKNGLPISGATSATYTIASAQASDRGTYHVVITNPLGTATSTSVTLTLDGAAAPAVFVNLSTTQATTAGETLVTAPTFTIAAPGNGWAYGAAAPYAGETWNNILSPNASDQIKPASNGYARYDVVPLITANNIALTQPDGTASGVTLTASAVLNDAGTATNTREVPRLVNVSSSTPAGLLGMAWRIYEGGNLLRFAYAGLPADAHYLVYCYGTTNAANQGARFTLADANSVVTPGVWFETNPAANTAPSLFVDTAGVLAPSTPAPLQVASNAAGGANAGTAWGVMHAKVDSAGKLVLDVGRNANNNGFPNGFQLVPYPKVRITTQPVAETSVPRGNSVTLTVAVASFDANDSVTYQWRKDGVPINTADNATANTASLTVSNAQLADSGSYSVAVTNLGGSMVSEATALTVVSGEVAPTFASQPVTSQSVLAGLSASFTAKAEGVPAPTYQWYKGSDPISGATSETYTIPSVKAADAGSYTVVASNSAGNVLSNASVLSITDPAGPTIVGDGCATGVTGGAGGTAYVVTTAADLNAKLQLAQPAIITVVGTIDVRTLSAKRVDIKSNKTLQGADANATILGSVNIDGVQNVIVRGLNISNPGTTLENGTGPRYVDGGDGITIRNCSNVMVTHCTFYDCADGMCDLTYDVANVTVSWCKFYYTAAQTSHRFTMILGNEATTVPINATLHHNWWSDRCDQRMPASSTARGHLYNNYFTCAGNYYANNARNNSQLFIEHSYFGPGVNDPVGKSEGTTAHIRVIGNIYDGTTGQADAGTDIVFTPTYSYDLNAAADVPTVVPAHAGNTAGAFSTTPATSSSITVLGAPASLYPGDTITLTPSVSGGSRFQWRFNNMEIAGATSESLVLSNIQPSQIGVYTVVVGHPDGTATVSAPVTLVSAPVPVFVGTAGGPVTVVTGKDVRFQATAQGGTLTYRWQRDVNGAWLNLADDAVFSGSTTSSLSVRAATTAQAGAYRLVATNQSGASISGTYTLAVNPVFFPSPSGVAVDGFGDLYVADSALNVIRKISSSGTATLVAGMPNTAGSQDGAFGKSALNSPGALAIDAFGNLYVADRGNATVRAVARDGTITTLAGDPTKRGNRDGIGTGATFALPNGLSFDRTNGVTYVADTNNHTIRRLTPQGLQTGLFAGNVVATISGGAGVSGDTDVAAATLPLEPGTSRPNVALARYNHPGAVCFAGSFLYVADAGNNTIRRISLASGDNQFTTETIAGTPGVTGSDDGTGVAALFNQPQALVAGPGGSFVYVADTGNNAIRRVSSTGVVTTIAGVPGISGMADGNGESALFNRPVALALDVAGTVLYVADAGNAAVRKVVISGDTATVTTISVPTASDALPAVPTTTPFTPTVDSQAGGGGGAPSTWYLLMIAAVAALRIAIKQRRQVQ